VKLEFSPAAQSDLMDIAMFIAQDNPKRALTFVEELEGKCEALQI
jgi:toxin ParE1/3/4